MDERPALCLQCHDGIEKKLAAKAVHPPARDGRCSHCHAPHGAGQAKLLTAAAAQLCFGCHQKAQAWASERSVHDPVRTGDCALCHDEARWTPARPTKEFDHAKYFALRGAHRTAACRACHVSLDFAKARTDCVGCHQDVHRGEFGQDCARCHTPRSFIDRAEMARLHHTTRFPLTGAHAAADCDECHRERAQGQLKYVGLASDCASCHDNAAFKTATQRPAGHVQANFPRDCGQCHNTMTAGGGLVITDPTRHIDGNLDVTGDQPCNSCHGSAGGPSAAAVTRQTSRPCADRRNPASRSVRRYPPSTSDTRA